METVQRLVGSRSMRAIPIPIKNRVYPITRFIEHPKQSLPLCMWTAEKICKKIRVSSTRGNIYITLCSLYNTGLQTRSADLNLLCTAVNLNANRLYIGLPHFVCSSMRVADIATKVSTLTTNKTLCHNNTSLYHRFVEAIYLVHTKRSETTKAHTQR